MIVRTLDTNVVVRLLIGDDLERQSRYALLERLVRTRGVVVDDIDAVIDALEHFHQGGDLADQLLAAEASP
jgi:predicted nucleic-acid-binding protein